jgi:hypothetical protein
MTKVEVNIDITSNSSMSTLAQSIDAQVFKQAKFLG